MLIGLLKIENTRIVASLAVLILITAVPYLGHTQTASPYPVYWINKVKTIANGSVLTKNEGPNTWGGGAISSNVLDPNADGWMEFSGATGAHCIIGLASDNKIDSDKFSHAIFLDQAANSYAIYEGSTATSLGGWQVGDVFKIGREGSSVNYYRNGAVVKTVSVNPALVLQVKAAIRFPWKSTPAIATSFDGRLILEGSVTAVDEINGSGSIAVSTSGGAAPYTYSWSSDEQTSSISSKPIGDYTVTVSDAVGHVQEHTYHVGYKLNWVNPIGVSVTGSILTKTAPISTWGNGGISSNVLSANTDGSIEFSGGYNDHYMVGFAANDVLDTDKFSHAILIDYPNNRFRISEGEINTGYKAWQTGDVFRISREGDTVKYYRNSTIIRTITANPALVLKVKATLQYAGQSTPYINSSFEGHMILQGAVTGMVGNSGSGSIALGVSGGTKPYEYNWSSGEQTASIIEKQRGACTVTVNDAAGKQKIRTYHVGYKVNWINPILVTINNGILTKTSTLRSWNAGAVSSNILASNTDGWIEFSTYSADDYIVGLAVNDIIGYSSAFSHSVAIDYLTNNYFLYSGSSGVGSGNWQTGDVFRISREGNVVSYYKNDEVMNSVEVDPTLVLKVKAALKYKKSTPIVNTSFWTSDGIVRTYYSIANGNWTTPSIWSLSENGPPSTVYPDDIDKVVIKGHEVTVNSSVKSAGITITGINENTSLKVDGSMGVLTVKGDIVMNRENNLNTAEVLLVQNNGKLDVKN